MNESLQAYMKETYVTGANGFLGRNLCERLDNFKALPHSELGQMETTATLRMNPFDKFFFLSTYGNMAWHDEEEKIIKANVLDLISVIESVDFTDCFSSFVFISSSSVKREVQTMYSRTKKAAEEILLAYMERYNAPICIVRPLSITGVGEQREHLIPTLIRSCLDGERMPFVEESVHDFIDVDDVVSGILTLSERRAKGIFELGSGRGVTNREVKEIVEKVTGKKANTTPVTNMRAYDSTDWSSTNFKARQFGWEPKKTLEQSVTEMVEAYKNGK